MALNGTSALISGKLAHSKKRGKAFIAEMSAAYGNEDSGARSAEGSKKPTKHGKNK